MPEAMLVLQYEYVDDIIDRRPPYRDAHLAAIREWHDDGRLLIAGAVGDPPHGAILVFQNASREDVEKFANNDPYTSAGLLKSWRVEPYAVVASPQR